MIHFCTMVNHTALPAAAPTRTSIAPQASRRSGAAVAGPMKRLATSIARYAPAARPLTGNTPAYRRPPAVEHLVARAPAAAADHRPAHQIMPAQVGAQRQSPARSNPSRPSATRARTGENESFLGKEPKFDPFERDFPGKRKAPRHLNPIEPRSLDCCPGRFEPLASIQFRRRPH